MKKLVAALILILMLSGLARSQSIEDLRKLEELKKQLEQGKQVPAEIKKKIPQAESLETFREEVTPPPVTEKEEIAASPVKPVGQKKEAKPQELPLFGFDIFKTARADFKPEQYGPVDANYPLGPGDELIITLWGEVELRHSLIINRQGQIYIPDVGLVNLVGLNVGQVKEKLTSVMGKSYSSLAKGKAFLDIALGKLRSIRVYVVGDVNNPGVFTVPALTPVFNLLFYAGGVKETGSLRNIGLVRGDKIVSKLDFYNFLTTGANFSNIRLQNHDVLLVPTAQKRVRLYGAVKKPAVYELKAEEGLARLISLAGGFAENAYIETILIERFIENKDRKLLQYDYRELIDKQRLIPLQDGDRITVQSIDRELKNFVTISGPVYGPTRFEYRPGMTIKDLFAQVDSIAGEAYLERVQITRRLDDGRRQLFAINLQEFFENPRQDMLLAPEDNIVINSRNTLFPPDSVSIYGAVNNPGKYLLKKDMTLKDLIFSAGGFRKDALITEAEVSRINPLSRDKLNLATILYVPVDSNYAKDLEPDKAEVFFLEPYDNVFIRANSDWELQRNVSVIGEVMKPGQYTLKSKTERITDLIARAGGLRPTAYLQGATFVRTQDGVGQIGVDFEKIYENPSDAENIFLQAGDRIRIPERLATVRVAGGVYFPSSVLYERGKGLDYYIKAAGGYVELADKDNVTVRLANGRPLLEKRFLFWKYLSDDITAGSTIYVPVLAEKEKIDWSGAIRDAAAVLASVATTFLILDRFK